MKKSFTFAIITLLSITLFSCESRDEKVDFHHDNVIESIEISDVTVSRHSSDFASTTTKVLRIETPTELVYLDSVEYWSGSGNLQSRTTIDNRQSNNKSKTIVKN